MDIIPKQNKTDGATDLLGEIKSRGISLSAEQSQWAFLLDKKALISFCVLALSLVAFGAIKIYNGSVDNQAQQLKEQADMLESAQNSEENLATIKKMSDIDKAKQAVEQLEKDHILSSLFFKSLEQLTLPEVKWSGMNVDTKTGEAQANGAAQSYYFLANQITNFEKNKFEISVSGIGFTKNGIEFSANIKFDPKILLK